MVLEFVLFMILKIPLFALVLKMGYQAAWMVSAQIPEAQSEEDFLASHRRRRKAYRAYRRWAKKHRRQRALHDRRHRSLYSEA